MSFISMRSICQKLVQWMGALIVALPSGAVGQSDTATIPRIGLLTWSACEEAWLLNSSGPFLRGLDELGHKPGESVLIECRSAGKSYDGLSAAAADLAQLPLDIIVGDSEPVAHAVRAETSTIPMVMIISGDPLDSGLAKSLAKPGGNVTGVTYYATELTAKRLEFLAELIPELKNVGVLANPNVAYMPFEEDAKRAASRLGITATVYQVREPEDLIEAFSQMKADGAQAVFVLPD